MLLNKLRVDSTEHWGAAPLGVQHVKLPWPLIRPFVHIHVVKGAPFLICSLECKESGSPDGTFVAIFHSFFFFSACPTDIELIVEMGKQSNVLDRSTPARVE